MAPSKPTLGFETKTEAIRHLHGHGFARATIARDLNTSAETVSTLLSRLHLKPNPAPAFRPHAQSSFIELSPDIKRLLWPHASRRGLTCAALAALIVDTVVMDGLADGVLDDRSDASC